VPAAASRGLHCFVVCAPRRHGHHSQRFVAPRAAAAASRKDDNEASASSRRAEGPEDDVAELMRDLASLPNVRLEFDDQGDEFESWDDIMDELEDPWMMHPVSADSPEPFAGMWDGEEVSSSGAPAGISAGASSYDSMQTVGYMELKTCVERWGNRGNIGSEVDEAAAVLLDVRSAEEFAASHVPGSTNVPLNQLRGSCAAELAAPPRPLLVVGSGDVRSAQACVRLSRVYGAMQVSHFEGGLAEYAQHAPLASSNDSGSP